MYASVGLPERGAGAPPDDPRADDWWHLDVLHEPVPSAGTDDESGGACAPWESVRAIADTAPGGELALTLDLVDVTKLDDLAVVETVAAWERLAAWAHLGAALAAGELSRRTSMNPLWRAPVPTNRNVAGDELAMRLGRSRKAADRLVRDGRALDNELLLVAEAVRQGVIDTPKMRVLTDHLHDRAGQLAWAVQEQVLPGAANRTPTQLAADVDSALLEVEPEDAAFRLPAATAKRRVCHPKRLPDGMAGIWAVLPAIDAVRVDATLEATARAARAMGDPRTLDQLRADTLTDLATGDALLAAGVIGGGPSGTRSSGEPAALPETRCPSEPAALPETACADRPAARSSAGHSDQLESLHEIGRADQPVPPPETRPQAPGIRVPRVRVDVTVALSTLLGLDDNPADLAGFGPISAEQARALAQGGVWRRLVTDPLSGAVLDVGRTRYRPPKPIADHVMARDQVCARPGCSVPANRCDLDHTTEYYGTPANGDLTPGGTSAANLGPLSERCHRLKTDGGFTLRQVAPGVFEWRTPAGLAYRVTPGDRGRYELLDTALSPGAPNPGYPDEPPF